LKILKLRIEEGSLGEAILRNMKDISREEIIKICQDLSKCLERNEVYV